MGTSAALGQGAEDARLIGMWIMQWHSQSRPATTGGGNRCRHSERLAFANGSGDRLRGSPPLRRIDLQVTAADQDLVGKP